MEEASDRLSEKVQALSDIELAVLVCLVAEQHCIIEAEEEEINAVQEELKLIAFNVFGFTSAVLDCDEHTTLDDFGRGILVKDEGEDYFSRSNGRLQGEFSSISGSPRMPDRRLSKSPRPFSPLDTRRIANIVIAKNLNRASSQVQIQALELMRGKRNFTRTAVHAAPKQFLLVVLNATGTPRLTMHLNDQISISHHHQVDDGLPNLEEMQEKALASEDNASTSSVVHTPSYAPEKGKPPAVLFPPEDLAHLTTLTSQVKISSEVRAYLHNIVVFMRLHRAVAGGISAMATRHFNRLASALAPLHGLDYISPSLVALAARKVYPHRIVITKPENERSMQWGSSLEAVKAVLEGVTVEDVIEEVLQSVEVPL
ncbi:Nn.00g101700.m01.CDS01 [Neocucurbitaria sp. VM-36]